MSSSAVEQVRQQLNSRMIIKTDNSGTLMKSIASTRVGGLITLLGVLTPNDKIPAEFIPSILFGAKISEFLSFPYPPYTNWLRFPVRGTAGFSRDAVIEFVQFVEANNIKPVIAQEFAFDDVVQAFEALQQQKAVGKIVVKIADEYGAETGDE
jgi:NADPH:quinone reductase-like Zn-dependent oxidoreductase